MNHQIGFIGGGNMAQAIITGLLNSGRSSSDILVSDPNPVCRNALSAMGVSCSEQSGPVIAQADLIVLAVKPQIMDTVLPNFPLLFKRLKSSFQSLQVSP